MALESFILHGSRRKIGNLVAYRNRNSRRGVTTAIREYRDSIANPRTIGQIDQRIKVLPAQNFYRGFRELLDHSWQGIAYKGRSYARFLHFAMGEADLVFPYLVKGTAGFFPGEYLMSTGGLPEQSVTIVDNDEYVQTQLRVDTFDFNSDTWGHVCSLLMAKNPYLRQGDFLTFVMVKKINNAYVPIYQRMKIDSSSTLLLAALNFAFNYEGSGGVYYFNFWATNVSGDGVAAALIHSRKPASRSAQWQRSNSRMVCTQAYKDIFMSQQAYAACQQSYADPEANVNADWYLNGGSEDGGASVFTNPLGLSMKSATIGGQTFACAKFSDNAEVVPYGKYLLANLTMPDASHYEVTPAAISGNRILANAAPIVVAVADFTASSYITVQQAIANDVDFSQYSIDADIPTDGGQP